ncbi:MAG: hypothetical protein ACMUIM_06485 [bacterium]
MVLFFLAFSALIPFFLSSNAYADNPLSVATLVWEGSGPAYRIFLRKEGEAYNYDDYVWQGKKTSCPIALNISSYAQNKNVPFDQDYQGQNDEDYIWQVEETDHPIILNISINDLYNNLTYYFVARAYDELSGEESPDSNEARFFPLGYLQQKASGEPQGPDKETDFILIDYLQRLKAINAQNYMNTNNKLMQRYSFESGRWIYSYRFFGRICSQNKLLPSEECLLICFPSK